MKSNPIQSYSYITLNMSDDEDYIDIGTDATNDENELAGIEPNLINGRRVRGKDIVWVECMHFDTTDDFIKSDFYVQVKKEFTKKMSREPDHADTENYICKFSRRRGYLPCPLQYKVSYLSHSEEVLVEANAVHPRHQHDPDPEYGQQGGTIFKWTDEQTEFMKKCLKTFGKPKAILSEMENRNMFRDGRVPTSLQLSNKVRHVRKLIFGVEQIFDTHELREKINENLKVPDVETHAYIAYHEVNDEEEDAEPRFNIIWTSQKLMKRIDNELTQDDATYRLLWQGNKAHFVHILRQINSKCVMFCCEFLIYS